MADLHSPPHGRCCATLREVEPGAYRAEYGGD